MLNKNDKKNIIVVILVLIIIMGILILARGCDRQEEKISDNSNNQEPTIVLPNEEEKENQGQSEDISNESPVVNEIVKTPIVEEDEVENLYPEIYIDQTYYIVSLGENFALPEISSLEDSEDSLEVNITYNFKSFDSDEFYPVFEFTTEKLGTYKITYHVENKNHYVSRLDIYVEVVDTTSPIIEGVITKYNAIEDTTEYIAVPSGSYINQSIDISFWDDDQISYVEYYNTQLDNTITGDTLEQEAMPTLIPVDINSILTLTEEGEYHIRVYDRSGNTQEYVIVIDLTLPIVEVEYEQVANNKVLVTITSEEKLKPIEGWDLSDDSKVMTKLYDVNILGDLLISDLADNNNLIHLEYQGIRIEILQNDIPTENRDLNQNDGTIKLKVTGPDNIDITYSIDNSDTISYTNGEILTQDGYYEFQITDGKYIRIIELSISSMGTND